MRNLIKNQLLSDKTLNNYYLCNTCIKPHCLLFRTYTNLQWTAAKNQIKMKNNTFSRQKKARKIWLFQKYRKYRTLLQKYRILQDKQKNTGHYRKYRTATRTVFLAYAINYFHFFESISSYVSRIIEMSQIVAR